MFMECEKILSSVVNKPILKLLLEPWCSGYIRFSDVLLIHFIIFCFLNCGSNVCCINEKEREKKKQTDKFKLDLWLRVVWVSPRMFWPAS